MKGRLLVVDDERAIAQLIRSVLKGAGYDVEYAEDSNAAFVVLQKEPIDLILLDVEMPGISGLRLLEMLRKDPRTAAVPIMILSVLGGESHKVRGLTAGADDYLVKPFSPRELLARVDAVLRRVQRVAQPSDSLRAGDIEVDLGRREVSIGGKRIRLTRVEFELLALLVRRKGFVLTYHVLSDSLSLTDKPMTSQNLYVQVKNLRQKLGSAGEMIETIHNMGYKLVEI